MIDLSFQFFGNMYLTLLLLIKAALHLCCIMPDELTLRR